jgi:hypothetical protein
MARSFVSERVVVRERYYWPPIQLNFWTIIILVTGSLLLGVFAEFITIQNRLRLGIPWYALSASQGFGMHGLNKR